MNAKSVFKWLLLAFVIVSLGHVLFRQIGQRADQAQPSAHAGVTPPPDAPSGSNPELGGVLQAGGQQRPTADETQSRPVAKATLSTNRRFIVYYFHTTVRCTTCRKIEEYAQEGVERGFGAELRSGRLAWRVVNVEPAENRHYISDYRLYTKSVVVSEFIGGNRGRYKTLEKVWELVGDKDEFQKYVQDEVRRFIESPI
jgi:hypothetical protein